MKFFYLLPTLFPLITAIPQLQNPISLLSGISTAANLPPELLPTYCALKEACDTAATDGTTYVSVQYANITGTVEYEYGDCYYYAFGNDKAMMAVFCKPVLCKDYTTSNGNKCGAQNLPLAVPIPKDVALVNPLGIVGYVGTGAICQPL